jgi:hypothetical protein
MADCNCPMQSPGEDRIAHSPEACDATTEFNGKVVICSEPGGHDGPHMACTTNEHPLTTWGDDDGE